MPTLRKLSLLLFLALWSCLVAPVRAVALPLSLAEYWQQLDHTRALVASAGSLPSATALAQLKAEADSWAAITTVGQPSGEIVPVDNSYLVAQLRAVPPNLKRLGQLLAGLELARQSWPASQHTAADLQPLADILARPEFQWESAQANWLGQLWQRLVNAFWRFISNLLPNSVAGTLNGQLLNYLITGLAAVVMLAMLAYLLRGLFLNFAPETAAAELAPHEEALTADSALKRAHALSTAGDFRMAVRYLYLSALLVLDERGLLRYDRSLTNHEYLKSVAHLPEVALALAEVVDVFDRVWYGYQPLDAAGFNQYAARVAELQAHR